MTHETRVELACQLEKIKQASEGPDSRRLFIAGTAAEIPAGVSFLGAAMRPVSNRFINRRRRPLYEAILEVPEVR
jgi:hypothetical protein